MFENDDDVDVDDDFLNVVFEDEGNDNNNDSLAGKLRPVSSLTFNTPSGKKESVNNVRYQNRTYQENFHTRQDLLSTSSENVFPEYGNIQHLPGSSRAGDKKNKRKVSPPPSRSKRERKFPGPAGLLPDRKSLRGTPLKLDNLPEAESPSASTPDELCSQGRLSGSVLEDGPWQSLISDLGSHADVLEVVNVASVKRKAAARCFVGRKVPFLAAALHHLDLSSADPCIILRDRTGEIHGTLHREVWQQFAAELVVGSVLVIRNVGLLSTGLSSRRHYLNITANNLATIYSANPDKPQKRELHLLTSQDYIKTIENWQGLVASPRSASSPASSLFNMSLPSSCSSSPVQSPQMNGFQPRLAVPLHASIPHASNTRPTTSQNTRGFGTPRYPRGIPPPRPTGKNLFPINSPNPVREFMGNTNSNLISANRPSGNGNQNNAGLHRNSSTNSSFLPQSVQRINTINLQNTQKQVPNMRPDSVKTTFNGAVHSSSFIENKSASVKENRRDFENSSGNNSSRILLSQSSQLTAEEQSVVNSVFDGIDADSLFDDDF